MALTLTAELMTACTCGEPFPKAMGVVIAIEHPELKAGLTKRIVGLLTCRRCERTFPINLTEKKKERDS